MKRQTGTLVWVTSILLLTASCVGPRPTDIGPRDGALAPCPESPNCVSSDATDDVHGIAPLTPGATASDWQAARDAVAAMPRTVIVSEREGYLHAESMTPIMRYVDDLELLHLPDEGVIAVRSASRVGYGDMNANRTRVEALRAALAAASAD